MARLAGVSIPENKHIIIGLTQIHGIGRAESKKILDAVGIAPDTKGKDLNEKDFSKLSDHLTKYYVVEGDLKEQVRGNIKRLRDINTYRGLRHSRNLPVRGQRTQCNARTVRGNVRRTVATGRKAPPSKT